VAVRDNVPLAPLTTLGVGGQARWFARAESAEDVARAHRWCRERSVPLLVLGGGSNLVVGDDGFAGLVLELAVTGVSTWSSADGTFVTAGAGEVWDAFVASMVGSGLGGVECLSGIPGTVGGTPIQNVGAYGQQVSSVIDHVVAFDRTAAAEVLLTAADCEFAYRTSRFKGEDAGRFLVCYVTFRLGQVPPTVVYPDVIAELDRAGLRQPDLAAVRRAVLAIRRRKGMVLDSDDADTRSVGSFFVNPVVDTADHERISTVMGARAPGFPAGMDRVRIPAAWLIERCGFPRGTTHGPVGLSRKHGLAIVNRGGATARDVVRFASAVKRGVADRCGVDLRPEPVFVGLDDDPDVGFLQRAWN
jgi:UDP-N-acetylmuramate dehydrogenase